MTLTNLEPGLQALPVQKARSIRRLLHEETGQDLIEYALIFTFIAFAGVASVRSVTTGIVSVFTAVGTALTSAT